MVYYLMVEMEKPPVHLELGSHDVRFSSSIKGISNVEDFMETQLTGSTKGKILFVNEDVYGTLEDARSIIELTAKGELPSDAFTLVNFRAAFGHDPSSKEEFASWKSQLLDFDPFNSAMFALLDRIQLRHPGRLYIVNESTTEERAQQRELLDEGHEELILNRRALLDEGRVTGALAFHKSLVRSFALVDRERDERLADIIEDEVGKNDILAVVGLFGEAHSDLIRTLSRKGFKVDFSFFKKVEGSRSYIFDPETEMMRRLNLFPEREPSEKEWYRSLLLNYLFTEFSRRVDITDDRTAHEVNQTVWSIRKKLTTENMDVILQAAPQVGLLNAILDTLHLA